KVNAIVPEGIVGGEGPTPKMVPPEFDPGGSTSPKATLVEDVLAFVELAQGGAGAFVTDPWGLSGDGILEENGRTDGMLNTGAGSMDRPTSQQGSGGKLLLRLVDHNHDPPFEPGESLERTAGLLAGGKVKPLPPEPKTMRAATECEEWPLWKLLFMKKWMIWIAGECGFKYLAPLMVTKH
ncbi:unnamed protein product, partial [Choristocarpus tenellus]